MQQKRGITISDPKQPLLVHGTFIPTISHVQDNNSLTVNTSQEHEKNTNKCENDEKSETKERTATRHVLLVPELCELLSFTSEMCHYGAFVPTILWHIDWMRRSEHLQSEILGHMFSADNRTLLRCALTHSTYANETNLPLSDYQRLEFLGDAVLELFASVNLYRLFPTQGEGKLTKLRMCLTSNQFFAGLAQDLQLEDFYLMSPKQQLINKTKTKLSADIFEAIIGLFSSFSSF